MLLGRSSTARCRFSSCPPACIHLASRAHSNRYRAESSTSDNARGRWSATGIVVSKAIANSDDSALMWSSLLNRQQQILGRLLKARQQFGAIRPDGDHVAVPDAECSWFVQRRLDVEHHASFEHVTRVWMKSRHCVVIDRGESNAVAGRMPELALEAGACQRRSSSEVDGRR